MGEKGSQVIPPGGQSDYEADYLWTMAVRDLKDNVSRET